MSAKHPQIKNLNYIRIAIVIIKLYCMSSQLNTVSRVKARHLSTVPHNKLSWFADWKPLWLVPCAPAIHPVHRHLGLYVCHSTFPRPAPFPSGQPSFCWSAFPNAHRRRNDRGEKKNGWRRMGWWQTPTETDSLQSARQRHGRMCQETGCAYQSVVRGFQSGLPTLRFQILHISSTIQYV